MNLISNALKFSKPFDIVLVRIHTNNKDMIGECSFLIEVIDTGCGISKEEQKKLFTPYFKTSNKKSLKKNKYGNGLGLSICCRILQ